MENPAIGIFLAVLMISTVLMVCRHLLNSFVFGGAPGRRAIRQAHHSLIAREAALDIDHEYEELLRS